MPLLKPFAVYKRLPLHSPLFENLVVSECSCGWLRQSFANRILKKHQMGFVPVIRRLHYFRWLRSTEACRILALSKFDLSLWINWLIAAQGKQVRCEYVNSKLQLLKQDRKQIFSSVWDAKFIPMLTAAISQLIYSKQILHQSDIRHLYAWIPQTFFSAQIKRLSSLTSFFNKIASITPQGKSDRYYSGQNFYESLKYLLPIDFMLNRTHKIEGYATSLETIGVQKNTKIYQSAEIKKSSFLVRYSSPQLMIRQGISSRVPIETTIETNLKINVIHSSGYAKDRFTYDRKQITGKHHSVMSLFVVKRRLQVRAILSRIAGHAHPIGNFHETSNLSLSNLDDNELRAKHLFVDGGQPTHGLLSNTIAISPGILKTVSKSSFAPQDLNQPLRNNFRSNQSSVQRYAVKSSSEILANDYSAVLQYPNLKYAQVHSKVGKESQKSNEAAHRQNSLAAGSISQVAPTFTGNSMKTVNSQLLADQVYGIIIDRVKTELRMRGR